MTELPRQPFSFEDYVLLEERGAIKHEFLDGHVWAMAGGSPEHVTVGGNLIRPVQGSIPPRGPGTPRAHPSRNDRSSASLASTSARCRRSLSVR